MQKIDKCLLCSIDDNDAEEYSTLYQVAKWTLSTLGRDLDVATSMYTYNKPDDIYFAICSVKKHVRECIDHLEGIKINHKGYYYLIKSLVKAYETLVNCAEEEKEDSMSTMFKAELFIIKRLLLA